MAIDPPFHFCPHCGSDTIAWRIPPGDDRERQVCGNCNTIHYRNPRNVAGCIAEHEGRILLCRRAIEPRHGYWTFPAGFHENGESLADAATRETREEACAHVTDSALYALFNLTHIGQVYAVFRGHIADGRAAAGAESLSVDWFTADEIPWDELAFPVIHEALRLYLADRAKGTFPVHMADIFRRENDELVVRHHDGAERSAIPDFRRKRA